MDNYKNKYIFYKTKYLHLKSLIGGGNEGFKNEDMVKDFTKEDMQNYLTENLSKQLNNPKLYIKYILSKIYKIKIIDNRGFINELNNKINSNVKKLNEVEFSNNHNFINKLIVEIEEELLKKNKDFMLKLKENINK